MCLPPHLAKARHWDWPWPLSYIPRRWTAFCFGHKPPKKLWGNQTSTRSCTLPGYDSTPGPAPIGEWGSWQISWPLYIAFTTKKGWHCRTGMRWDDIDGYYNWSLFARRWFPEDGVRDTSTN